MSEEKVEFQAPAEEVVEEEGAEAPSGKRKLGMLLPAFSEQSAQCT